MKKLLLILIIILFSSCKDIPAQIQDNVIVTSVYTMDENFKTTGLNSQEFKYKVGLNSSYQYVYLYTNTPYKVGDTLK